MCTNSSKYISLPMQDQFCSQRNSACGYAEVKTKFQKWEKRLIVFAQDDVDVARLIIYKEPLMGRIYSLKNLKQVKVKKEPDHYHLQLKTERKQKLSIKFKGVDSSKWIGAIVSSTNIALKHTTHPPLFPEVQTQTQTIEMENKSKKGLLQDKPDADVYTGTRVGYQTPKLKKTISNSQKLEAAKFTDKLELMDTPDSDPAGSEKKKSEKIAKEEKNLPTPTPAPVSAPPKENDS